MAKSQKLAAVAQAEAVVKAKTEAQRIKENLHRATVMSPKAAANVAALAYLGATEHGKTWKTEAAAAFQTALEKHGVKGKALDDAAQAFAALLKTA